MDISGSEYILWTYPTPSRTNWALYLSRAGQIRLRTILSFLKSYKILTLLFLADFRSQLSLFLCLAFVKKKKKKKLFSLHDSITSNIAKAFTLCSQYST